MTYANLTTWDEALKTFYLPGAVEQLNHSKPMADLLEVNEEDVEGTDATIEMHYGRTTGIGARADGGDLPDANYQKHKKATVPMKYVYGRVSFTGPTIKATKSDRGSYARVIDREVKGLIEDLGKEVNRMFWGIGYGVLARWRSSESTTSYTLQKRYTGNDVAADGFASTFGAKYLEEMNNAVPVVFTASATVATVLTVDATNIAVSAITTGTNYDTVTCTNPDVTEAAGTFYVRPGNLATCNASTAAGAQRYEPMGLRGIVTDQDLDEIICYDGTNTGFTVNDPLQGLAVATYTWFTANVDSLSTRYSGQRSLTFSMMDKMFDRVEKKAGKDYGPDSIWTTRAIRREYLELCRIDRRAVNTMTLDGGWKAVEYNGIPLLVDDDAVDGEMYFLTLKDLQVYRMSDYEWMQKDGAVLSRISDKDAYEAVLFRYHELGCQRRNSQGVICDLAYTPDGD